MSGSVQNDGWTQKATLKSSGVLGGLSLLALLFTAFKLKPYFNNTPTVKTFTGGADQSQQRRSTEPVKKTDGASLFDALPAFRQLRSGASIRANGVRMHVKVIERPLLDGLTVTVSATLTRGISSLEPDASVEAVFGVLIRSGETRELDDSSLKGGKLMGVATPNMDLKRMVLKFSELVTLEGRSYAIQATAIDPETQTVGVPADYSSRLGSRLVGVGISRVITAGDQLLMNQFMPNSSNASAVQQAAQEVARQMNDQAANDISLEATRGLRETKAELTLPAGTTLTLRLRALPEQPQKE